MRNRMLAALVIVFCLALAACSPSAVSPAAGVSLPSTEGAASLAAQSESAGQFIAVARTAVPIATEEAEEGDGGQGAGGAVKRPGADGSGAAQDVFEFVSHTAWIGEDGDINIVGEVTNVSDAVIDTQVSVVVALFDADGDRVEGDFGAYLDRPVIEPGDTSSFWVPIWPERLGDTSVDDITDYELSLWISDDPSTEVELTVTWAEASDEDDCFLISGEVENETDSSFDLLIVYSTLYDEDGNVINATLDWYAPDEPLGPGDTTEFEGCFYEHYEGADSYYVFVTGYAAGDEWGDGDAVEYTSGDGVLDIVSHTGFVSQYGGVSIVGEAQNISDETLHVVVVVEVLLWDEDGNPIGDQEFSAYLDRPVIEPGGTSSFWVPISDYDLGDATVDDIDEYEILTWISNQPSPDVELTVTGAEGSLEDDIFLIEGTVLNQTDMDILQLSVYSTLYDEDEEVINATLDWIELDEPLAPGEETDFYGYFDEEFEDAASYYVFVTGYPEGDYAEDEVEEAELTSSEDILAFVSHSGFVSDYGGLSVVGEAENISDETLDVMVLVEVTLWDEDGYQIGEDSFTTYLDRPVLEAGDTSSFWVPIYADELGDATVDDVSEYEVVMWLTDEPSPDVELTVTDVEGGIEDDIFLIQGTVLNETDLEFAFLSVFSTLYDEDGNVINATADWVAPEELLAPGEEIEFQGYFDEHFEDADAYSVIVTGYAPWGESSGAKDASGLRSTDGILEVTSHSGFLSDFGGIHIVGEAENISDETLDVMVVVEVWLYDVDGNQVGDGEFSYYLDRPVLEPGETSSFWIPIWEDELGGASVDDVDEYEIYLWLTDEPSPDVELTVVDDEASIEDGIFAIEGTVLNETDLEFVGLSVYSTLYDSDGEVLNVTADWIDLDVPLEPGEETDFYGYFNEHFDDAAYYWVVVSGYTAEALGW